MSKTSSTCISQLAQVKDHLASSPGRGGATPTEPLILYDIKSTLSPGMAWSPNAWKTRFILNYKQIPYKTIWLACHEIEPTLAPQGFKPTPKPFIQNAEWYTIPAIADPSPEQGGEPTLVVDSQVIAEYLDAKYPDRPLLPEGTKAFQAMFLKWIQTNILPHIALLVASNIQSVLVDDTDKAHFVRTREQIFGKKFTEGCIGEERAKRLAALEKELGTLDEFISRNCEGDFLMGTTPSYADILLCAFFMWAKRIPSAQDPGFHSVFDIIKTWHGGRWERLQSWSEQYAEEK